MRLDIIKSSDDISDAFSSGKRVSNQFVTIIIKDQQKNEQSKHDLHGRVAFIAGKKWGNAVWRNASKRRLREICRQLGGPWDGCDVLFVAKPSLLTESYSKVLITCEKTLVKCFPDRRNALS